ncbi:hypothetical protein PsorP6_012402 [Peronosclerospora sorghi]|uniref:Uncharacterized protein n=1 Tax=Peronosclerospora sorghi TaxID=230839 RepID=A0ACC0WHA7_9STRA|nr:hypothetical protein PsorP6_012402 [Peronosclerospora sorghi]
MKKSVRWSTVIVYEFGVSLGGSAVPKHGGPLVGLAFDAKTQEDDVEEYEMVLNFPKSTVRGGKKDSEAQEETPQCALDSASRTCHDAHQGRLQRKPHLPHHDGVVGDRYVSTSNTPSF